MESNIVDWCQPAIALTEINRMRASDDLSAQSAAKNCGLLRGELQVRNWRHSWGSRTLLMGIVNVTPDSFSGDGITDAHQAVRYAIAQRNAGADLIDLGAESTRPGHKPVDSAEELARLLPVIKALRAQSDCIISIDTTKPEVLTAALDAGADILNSIWGLTDDLLKVVQRKTVPVVLMHNKHEPRYEVGVVEEMLEFLQQQADRAIAIGISRSQIILDPGIGFGKTAEHNLQVLHSLDKLVNLGFPTLLGSSRKSFIGKLTGKNADSRVFGTAASVALAIKAGIDIVRVHDVEVISEVIAVSDAIVRGTRPARWES